MSKRADKTKASCGCPLKRPLHVPAGTLSYEVQALPTCAVHGDTGESIHEMVEDRQALAAARQRVSGYLAAQSQMSNMDREVLHHITVAGADHKLLASDLRTLLEATR